MLGGDAEFLLWGSVELQRALTLRLLLLFQLQGGRNLTPTGDVIKAGQI